MVANQPPRARYAGVMLLASALGVACAFLVAKALSTNAQAPGTAAGIVAGAAIVGLLPAFIGSAKYFGVTVMGASVARLLIVMVGAFAVTQLGDVPKRPLWLGAVSGALLILIAESALSVAVIAAMERRRTQESTPPTGAGVQESPGSC